MIKVNGCSFFVKGWAESHRSAVYICQWFYAVGVEVGLFIRYLRFLYVNERETAIDQYQSVHQFFICFKVEKGSIGFH